MCEFVINQPIVCTKVFSNEIPPSFIPSFILSERCILVRVDLELIPGTLIARWEDDLNRMPVHCRTPHSFTHHGIG